MMAQSLPFSKWNKHVFQIFLLTILLSIPLSLQAQRFVVDGIGYEVTSTTDFTVEVIDYSFCYNPNGGRLEPYSGDIIIPSTVSNEGVSYAVTSIGKRAFSSCDNLTSIILPNTLTTIGENAFYGCSNLTSISIPNSVNFIGDETFWACKKLSTVTLPSSLQSIEYGLFAGCESLTSIIIPNSVKSVSKYSFSGCESLKFVSVGKSVQEVNTQAFDGCPVEDVEFHCDEIKVGMFGDYHSASHKNYKTIKHVTICDGVQKINDWAFRDWGNLETVQMSNTVKTIGRGAFWECKKLFSVNLSNSLTSMGQEAFCYCESLLSISIPSSLKTIPEMAFYGCRSLTSVKIANGVTTIEESAFVGCEGLTSITIPDSVTSIGSCAFNGCGLTSVFIPLSVTKIGCNPFVLCELLKEIRVAADNPNYDSRNDCNCIINTSENKLISGCYNSTIPNTIKSIADGAFYGCSRLTSINIPVGVTSIDEEAFHSCASLNSIVLPKSITNIGERAFYGCTSLNSITSLIEAPFPIADKVFAYWNEDKWKSILYTGPVYVPIGTKRLYENTDGWRLFTDIQEMAIDDSGAQYGDNGEVNDTTDLNGHVIGNIYYNISDENGEYSSAEGCIILRKPTTDEQMNEVVGMDLFGEDLKNNYTGIIFMVQAGSGTIKVNAETVGSMTLKVKIGNNQPVSMELEGKMKASFPYNVTEPTYVYIYGGETASANARGMRKAEATENALKIYGIEWSESDTPTHVEAIRETSSSDTPTIYNLQGQRMQSTSRGINIVNGKKVFVK